LLPEFIIQGGFTIIESWYYNNNKYQNWTFKGTKECPGCKFTHTTRQYHINKYGDLYIVYNFDKTTKCKGMTFRLTKNDIKPDVKSNIQDDVPIDDDDSSEEEEEDDNEEMDDDTINEEPKDDIESEEEKEDDNDSNTVVPFVFSLEREEKHDDNKLGFLINYS